LRKFWEKHAADGKMTSGTNELTYQELLLALSVLNGKRRLTVEHIDRLAAFFNIPHSYFFEPMHVEPLHRATQANQVESN
jgi:hypothetical protein